ncbi:MAG: hypothetical protein Q9M18_04615, partial [Mariprofundaceae bacterium]|nr:hypothetical protein [Mariprofundaceae bacterium]
FNIPKPTQGETLVGGNLSIAPKTQIATNAQQEQSSSTVHPSDLIAAQGAKQADEVMGEWLAQIEVMLAEAEDLPQFREMMLAAFGDLNPSALANIVANASMSAGLAGRFDIAAEDS